MLNKFKSGELVISVKDESEIEKVRCWSRGIGIKSTLGFEYFKEIKDEYKDIAFRSNNCHLNCTELDFYKRECYEVVSWSDFSKELLKLRLSQITNSHIAVKMTSTEECQEFINNCIERGVLFIHNKAGCYYKVFGEDIAFSLVGRNREVYAVPHVCNLLVDTMTYLTVDEIDFENRKHVDFMEAMCSPEFKVVNSGVVNKLVEHCIKESTGAYNIHNSIEKGEFVSPNKFMAWLSLSAGDDGIKQVIQESKFIVKE